MYVTIDRSDSFEVDFWDVYDALTDIQQREVREELVGISDKLDDPVRRLELITALRAEGYSVEPV